MFIYLFIERGRNRDDRQWEGQREREREKIPSRLCTVSTEPDAGLEFTTMNP